MEAMVNTLVRPRQGRVVAGVCAGIARVVAAVSDEPDPT